MKDLIEEHAFGRQTTKSIVEANIRYRNGDETAVADITANLKTLTEFYPRHIEKEDKVFFPSSRIYFTDEEDQAMLKEFWAFDRKNDSRKIQNIGLKDLKVSNESRTMPCTRMAITLRYIATGEGHFSSQKLCSLRRLYGQPTS